jgi:inner membrane protein
MIWIKQVEKEVVGKGWVTQRTSMYLLGSRYLVDSLTHAFLISALAVVTGTVELIPFLILGSVIPDIDILFKPFSDRSPKYYIFTHGGLTHCLLGSVITGICAFLIAYAIAYLFSVFIPTGTAMGFVPLVSVMVGAVSHTAVDFLSSPGIPVLYPISDRKYSFHIFAGPSIFMLFISIIFATLLLSGLAGLNDLVFFLWIFIAILAVRTGLKAYIAISVPGRIFPTPHLLKWVILNDTGDSVEVRRYQLPYGLEEGVVFPKFLNTTPEEIFPYQDLPEVRRHRFYSYLSVAEKTNETISFHDPLRENHYF